MRAPGPNCAVSGRGFSKSDRVRVAAKRGARGSRFDRGRPRQLGRVSLAKAGHPESESGPRRPTPAESWTLSSHQAIARIFFTESRQLRERVTMRRSRLPHQRATARPSDCRPGTRRPASAGALRARRTRARHPSIAGLNEGRDDVAIRADDESASCARSRASNLLVLVASRAAGRTPQRRCRNRDGVPTPGGNAPPEP